MNALKKLSLKISRMFTFWRRDERGTTTTEWMAGMIVALVVLGGFYNLATRMMKSSKNYVDATQGNSSRSKSTSGKSSSGKSSSSTPSYSTQPTSSGPTQPPAKRPEKTKSKEEIEKEVDDGIKEKKKNERKKIEEEKNERKKIEEDKIERDKIEKDKKDKSEGSEPARFKITKAQVDEMWWIIGSLHDTYSDFANSYIDVSDKSYRMILYIYDGKMTPKIGELKNLSSIVQDQQGKDIQDQATQSQVDYMMEYLERLSSILQKSSDEKLFEGQGGQGDVIKAKGEKDQALQAQIEEVMKIMKKLNTATIPSNI